MFTTIVKKVMNQIHQVPSLRQLALVIVAAEICHRDDIKTLLRKCKQFRKTCDIAKFKKQGEWKKVQSKAAEEVSKLCMVQQIKPEILELVLSMMLEVLQWIGIHSVNPYLRIRIPKQFCWTGLGNLDKKRTAEWILRNETLAVRMKYKLACVYCLEEEIRSSWQQMSSDDKERFSVNEPETTEITKLGFFWCHLMQHEFGTCSCSGSLSCEGVLRVAATDGNVTATKFLLQKISPELKKEVLWRIVELISAGRSEEHFLTFPDADHYNVWYFLVSQMEEKDQLVVFEIYSKVMLECLLHQHRQVFFMETVEQLWHCLTEQQIAHLLTKILHLYVARCSSFLYSKLFIDLWRASSQSFKTYVSTSSMSGGELLVLLIRNEVPDLERRRSHVKRAKYICKFLRKGSPKPPLQFDENKWRFLNVLLQEHIATRDSLTMYKDYLIASPFYKDEWDQHLDLIDRILADFQ